MLPPICPGTPAGDLGASQALVQGCPVSPRREDQRACGLAHLEKGPVAKVLSGLLKSRVSSNEGTQGQALPCPTCHSLFLFF